MSNKNPKPAKVINSKNSAELERQLEKAKLAEMQAKLPDFQAEIRAVCDKYGMAYAANLIVVPHIPKA